MRGFKKKTRKWVHHLEFGTRKLAKIDEINALKLQGWIDGSGVKRDKGYKYVFTYEPFDFTNECTPFLTDMTDYRKITKRVLIDDLKHFLKDNPIWRKGRGNHYNKGSSNGMHMKSSLRPSNCKRMFNPNTNDQGRYIEEDEVQHYLELGWIIGLRTEKWICNKCNSELTHGRKVNHTTSSNCFNKYRRMELIKMSNLLNMSFRSFSKSNHYIHFKTEIEDQIRQRYQDFSEGIQ